MAKRWRRQCRKFRQACRGGSARRAKLAWECCGKAASGAQTDVLLPHTVRDVLWTASCQDPVADFDDDDGEGVVTEAPASSLSVLDVHLLEVLNYDDANMDDTDELDDVDDDEDELPAMEASEDESDDAVDVDDLKHIRNG